MSISEQHTVLNPILETLRQKGNSSFAKQGLPTSKNESFKYTKFRELNLDNFVFAKQEHKCCCNEHKLGFDAYEIVFCNGKLCHNHCSGLDKIEVLPLIDAIKDKTSQKYLNKSFDMDNFPFAALNNAYLEQGLFIRVAKDYVSDKPLALVYHLVANEKYFCNIHNVVVLENNAQLDLVEYYYHAGDIKAEYFNNVVNEFFISKNATLNHYKVQNDAFKAFHIALNVANVKQNGRYDSFCLQKGALLARNETVVKLLEEKAQTEVNGAYVINGWATADTSTYIEHLHSETYSNQLVKGVVGDYAKGVFQGKIYIAPDTAKINGYQLHKALLLSDDAVVNVKPELEIFADDVKCSHGSTCGEIDKEQMFYLRSRGISEQNAKQILITAFINELFNKISNPNIISWLKSF
ncbi:MAG: Fe-S cluster assembly protein SufD [Alphaproteobacteria bacterium]|nr:Fe-S cluster assembly protein SufD [Alphaproteobacteria bacterium]